MKVLGASCHLKKESAVIDFRKYLKKNQDAKEGSVADDDCLVCRKPVSDSPGKERITEASVDANGKKVIDTWYDLAKVTKLEDLPAFMSVLATGYVHDYGTICHAIAASAIAAAHAMDRTDQGGITGYQAGAVMWEFIKHWGIVQPPVAMVEYRNMLFPQYKEKFMTISKETFELLQKEAQDCLDAEALCVKNSGKSNASDDVVKHWESIVAGVVPFGYKIRSDVDHG